MIIVIIPVLFLMLVSAVKKIPFIGGNLIVAFVGTGVLALVLGGVYDPVVWAQAWLTGLNQVAFIIFIVIFGSIFSALQVKSGAMDTVLNVLRAIFGHTPQGLVLAILIAMCLGGSLVGTVSAVGAVIGMLVVPAMDDMGLDPDMNCAIIVTGGSLGAIMPPISNAINVACSILGIPTDQVLQISYLTVGAAFILTCLFVCKVYIGDKYQMPQNLIPTEKASSILKREWRKLIPLMVLILLVALNSIPAISFDVTSAIMKAIPMGDSNLYACLSAIPVIGQIAVISEWASGLSSVALKLGGAGALILGGMLVGAQSTSQTTLLPILGPAWMATGVSDVHAAVASSHLAAAGQGLPPADLNTFVIAGLVSSLLQRQVNPMRSMILTAPYCILLAVIGLAFLFI